MSAPHYEFSWRTESIDAVPEALQGSVYWYDSGSNALPTTIYYDTSDTYAYYYDEGADASFITLISDIGGVPAGFFEETSPGVLTGNDAWSGTLTMSSVLISDAWYRAETAAFESLRDFVGATEGRECFRGFLPVQGDSDDDKYTNVWQFTSGDSAEFEFDRIQGDNPNWCSFRADARIESTWETRELAMKFAGAVVAWLKSTTNLKETGNVTWCTLAEMPDEPEIYRTDGKNRRRLWRQTINLELVYKTESNYN